MFQDTVLAHYTIMQCARLAEPYKCVSHVINHERHCIIQKENLLSKSFPTLSSNAILVL
jgi:hypothetical protein